jgi:hypothetical protein
MSSGYPPNPFGDPQANPYASPQTGGPPGYDPRQAVKGKVMAPAIALMVVAGLGLVLTIYNTLTALVGQPPPIDPNLPPVMQEVLKNSHGTQAAVIQGIFVVVNIIILAGAVQMLRMRMRPFAIGASVLAMLNIGSCCCILGLPIGIWSLVVLMGNDVANAFDQPA